MVTAPASELLSQRESASGPTVAQVRGALIVSALQTLREIGFLDRYLRLLPKVHHDELLLAIASRALGPPCAAGPLP